MTSNAANNILKAPNISGNELLKGLARLMQIGKLYDDNNKLTIDSVNAFKRAVTTASDGNSHVTLQIFNGRFYLHDAKIPLIRKEAKIFNQMFQFLEDRSIFGFHFNADLNDVPTKDILAFIRFLNISIKHDNPCEWLKTEIVKWDIHWLAIIQEPTLTVRDDSYDLERDGPESLSRKKEAAKKTYHYALNSVKEVAEKLVAGKEVGIRKPVRMVQRMVDIITDDERTFFALSTIRMYDDYTFAHSLNVALLAMSLGKQIKMDKKSLEKLGLCGMFHDLGKIEIPKHILNKKGKLNDSEFEEIKKHSVNSAMLILKMKTNKYRKVHLFVSPFEHHIRYDHSGYPSIDKKRPISLFGRILTIVDVYDAITSPRVYRQSTMSPDQALGLMLADSGKHFDPILLKAFVNMLGVYPVGTILKLDTGEMGLALHSPSNAGKERPSVQLLNMESNNQYTKGKIINLAERDMETGKYQRNIVKTQHPASLGIQPAQYII